MSRFRIVSTLVVFTLLLSIVPLHAAQARIGSTAYRTVPASVVGAPPQAEPTQDDLDCNTSPFGRQLVLGRDNEVFLSFTDNSGLLHYQRFDVDGTGNFQLQKDWTSPDAALSTNQRVGAVTIDRDGDERVDFVQAMQTKTDQFTLVSHTASDDANHQVRTVSGPSARVQFSAAAGNLLRNATSPARTVVVAAIRRGPGGSGQAPNYVEVRLPFSSNVYWRNNALLDAVDVQVATGDLDLDGYDDEIVLGVVPQGSNRIELFVLEYTLGYTASGANDLKALSQTSIEVGDILEMRVAVGNIDGDYQDEVSLAYAQDQPANRGFANSVTVRNYNYNKAVPALEQRNSWQKNSNVLGKSLGLSVGDTDADGLGEVAVGYINFFNSGRLALHTLDAEFATVVDHNYFERTDTIDTSTSHSLSLAVDDLNRNGRDEIVAAYRHNNSRFRIFNLQDQEPNQGMVVRGTTERDGVANWLNVQLGDRDNDSLKAQYGAVQGSTLVCKRVTESNITSAVFVPPFWQNIQDRDDAGSIFGSIGESRSVQQSNSTVVSNSYGHSVSVYLGAGAGFGGFVNAQVKATGGYEFSASQSRGDTSYSSETVSEGWESGGDFVVFDRTVYDCYVYQMTQGGQPVQGSARFCAANRVNFETAAQLDTWDTTYSPVGNPNELTYAPVARDWSSLTLFRGPSTAQSSTADGATADRAVDTNTSGTNGSTSVTRTNAEPHPWWQVDLGTVQEISKVRVWNRTGLCGAQACGAGLQNFRVFVSDTDFRSIGDNPDALRTDARVRTYEFTGVAGPVVSFNTLLPSRAPILGRFVRVQRVNSGVLELAEVQVFGPNHVEPHRFPSAVRDTNPNDGFFEVDVFNERTGNFETVRQRGKLLWNGTKPDGSRVLGNKVIGPGQAVPTWSRQQETGGETSEATTIGHTGKIGAEVEVEASLFASVSAGASYEYTQGVETEQTVTRSWGIGFEIGGGVEGFPQRVNGNLVEWPSQCAYKIQPYYYETSDQSNLGSQHKYVTVDYLVLDGGGSLNRRADMGACERGEYLSGANSRPQAQNDSATTAKNTAISIAVLGNDTDPNAGTTLAISEVGGPLNGTARIEGNSIVYTPNTNFVGTDQFSYTVTDGALASSATVSVEVTAEPPQPTSTATVPPGSTPTATVPPGSTPTATSVPGGAAHKVYLPLVRR